MHRHRNFVTPQDQAEGFAATDALVALIVLAVTLILTLAAVTTARRAALASLETQRAGQVLQAALQIAPFSLGDVDGRLPGFQWRVSTTLSVGGAQNQAFGLCQRAASARSTRSGRSYGLTTAEICPVARTP